MMRRFCVCAKSCKVKMEKVSIGWAPLGDDIYFVFYETHISVASNYISS
jgi:hypothetical protein